MDELCRCTRAFEGDEKRGINDETPGFSHMMRAKSTFELARQERFITLEGELQQCVEELDLRAGGAPAGASWKAGVDAGADIDALKAAGADTLLAMDPDELTKAIKGVEKGLKSCNSFRARTGMGVWTHATAGKVVARAWETYFEGKLLALVGDGAQPHDMNKSALESAVRELFVKRVATKNLAAQLWAKAKSATQQG